MRAKNIVLSGLMAVSACQTVLAGDLSQHHATLQDFYLFSCVQEYSRAHDFPLFDNSVGYAVEYSNVDPDALTRAYEAARQFASTLPAPDMADREHGGVAVLALCQEQSRSRNVKRMLDGIVHKKKKALAKH